MVAGKVAEIGKVALGLAAADDPDGSAPADGCGAVLIDVTDPETPVAVGVATLLVGTEVD